MRQQACRFAVVLVVAGVLGVLAAQPAVAGCHCPTGGTWLTTENTWGWGSTCSAAHTDMVNRAKDTANLACENGACAFGAVTINWGCEPSSMPGHEGQIQEDGMIQYKCLICWDPPGGGGGQQ